MADKNNEIENEIENEETLCMERRKKKPVGKRVRKVLLIVLVVLIVFAGAFAATYFGLRAYGKRSLLAKVDNDTPIMEDNEEAGVEVVDDEEGTIRYQGKLYKYNEEMMNVLFMGIDQSGELQSGEGASGRSDLIILAAIDNKNKKVTLFNINRNTMTDITIYNDAGEYVQQSTAQLALAYSYGDGKEQSAELVEEAVSNLLYQLPIHAYCALNLDAIPSLNDMVGGVTVTLTQDWTEIDSSYVQGAQVTLQGEAALKYVRYRNTAVDGSNEGRMERQKQYMSAFIAQAKTALAADLTLPISMYQTLQPYMVTDISVDQAVYLVTQVLGYSVDSEMRTLPGTVSQGDLYAEYHVDETQLYDLIINEFYEAVEEND